MTNRKLLFILSLTLFLIAVGGLNVRALTITNVSVHPNPFSPNGDGVKDTTTISFIISDIPAELDRVIITFDAPIDSIDVVPDTGENKYIWDGSGLLESVYRFQIAALQFLFTIDDIDKIQIDLDNEIISEGLRQEFENNGISLSANATVFREEEGSRWLITDKNQKYAVRKEENKLNIYAVLANAFSSVIIDTDPPEIENVFVSLSPFSPNGDGINDVTEISFDISGTNPPGFVDNYAGTITFDSEESGSLEGSLPSKLPPFGVHLVVEPDSFAGEQISFTINGSYKGAYVVSSFTFPPPVRQVTEELYDKIDKEVTEISGATPGDTFNVDWVTGNAVVNIYSSDGAHIQTLRFKPFYGDRNNYHVRWEPTDLSDGVYTYRILAEDGAGNVSQRSGQIILSNSTMEISKLETSLSRIAPANEEHPQYQNTVITYNLSKAGIVTVKIFDPDDNLVKNLADGESKKEGAQSETWDGRDNEGGIVSKDEEATYTYVITAVDPLTSDTVKASGNIIVDNQPPQAPQLDSISPYRTKEEPTYYTNQDLITVIGTAEPGTTVQISVAGVLSGEAMASTITGEFSLSSVFLTEGMNRITAKALDSVANPSEESDSLYVQLDKTLPVTTTKDVPKGWQQEKVTVSLKAIDEDGGSGISTTY